MTKEEQSILRGKKWFGIGGESNEWFNKNQAIIEDIKNYLDSIKKPEKAEKVVKVKEE